MNSKNSLQLNSMLCLTNNQDLSVAIESELFFIGYKRYNFRIETKQNVYQSPERMASVFVAAHENVDLSENTVAINFDIQFVDVNA